MTPADFDAYGRTAVAALINWLSSTYSGDTTNDAYQRLARWFASNYHGPLPATAQSVPWADSSALRTSINNFGPPCWTERTFEGVADPRDPNTDIGDLARVIRDINTTVLGL